MHLLAFILLATLSSGTDHPAAAADQPAAVGPPVAVGQPAANGRPFFIGIAPRANNAPVAVPEPSPKAMEYYHSGNVLWIV